MEVDPEPVSEGEDVAPGHGPDPGSIELAALEGLASIAAERAPIGAEIDAMPDATTEQAAVRFSDVTAGCIAAFHAAMPLDDQVSVNDPPPFDRPGFVVEPLAHRMPDPRGFLLEAIISGPFVSHATGVTSPESVVPLVAGLKSLMESEDGRRLVETTIADASAASPNATQLVGTIGMALGHAVLDRFHETSEARAREATAVERRGPPSSRPPLVDLANSSVPVPVLVALLYPPDKFGAGDVQRRVLQQVLLHASGLPVFDARVGVPDADPEWRCALAVGLDAGTFAVPVGASGPDAAAYAALDEAFAVLSEWRGLQDITPDDFADALAMIDPGNLSARARLAVVRCAEWLELLRASFRSLQENFFEPSEQGLTLFRTGSHPWPFVAGQRTFALLGQVTDLDLALRGHGARFDYTDLDVQTWAFAHRALMGARENEEEPGAVERAMVLTPQEVLRTEDGGAGLASALLLPALAGLVVLGAYAVGLAQKLDLVGEAKAYLNTAHLSRPTTDFFDTAQSLAQLRDDQRLLTVFSGPERALLWMASGVGGVMMLAKAMLSDEQQGQAQAQSGAYDPRGAVFLLGALHAALEGSFVTAALTTFSRSPEVWRVLHSTARALLFSAVGGELATAMQQLVSAARAEQVAPTSDVVFTGLPQAPPALATTTARLRPFPLIIDPYDGGVAIEDFVAAALTYATAGDAIAERQL